MPVDDNARDSLPDDGIAVVAPDRNRGDPDLSRSHEMYYVTATPRGIANSFHRRYGDWPRYVAYPPNIDQSSWADDKAWLEERNVLVIRCAAAKNWAYCGPIP